MNKKDAGAAAGACRDYLALVQCGQAIEAEIKNSGKVGRTFLTAIMFGKGRAVAGLSAAERGEVAIRLSQERRNNLTYKVNLAHLFVQKFREEYPTISQGLEEDLSGIEKICAPYVTDELQEAIEEEFFKEIEGQE